MKIFISVVIILSPSALCVKQKNTRKSMFVKQAQFCETIFIQNDNIDKIGKLM